MIPPTGQAHISRAARFTQDPIMEYSLLLELPEYMYTWVYEYVDVHTYKRIYTNTGIYVWTYIHMMLPPTYMYLHPYL
jgi:hypothetical protein